MIRHILFDCDGVLVDTEFRAGQVMVEILNDLGVHISLEEYFATCTGSTFSNVINEQVARINLNLSDKEKELIKQKAELMVSASATPIKGIAPLLEMLTLPIAVVSNSDMKQIQHSLENSGLNGFFQQKNLFSSEQVEKAKPFPDIYLFAAKSLGVQPKELLVVEDSLNGVKAAVQAGMNVIAFCGGKHVQEGHNRKLMEAGAMGSITSYDEFPNQLQKVQLGLAILEGRN